MFHRQVLGTGAFAALERIEQHVVLAVGVEHPVAVQRHGALHRQHGGRGGEGQFVVQRHGALQGAVAAGVQDQRVKAVVHAGVGGVALQRERVVGQQAVARLQAGLQVALQLARHAVLGHQSRGHALQVAAHGNRIGHFARGELAHQVFAGVAGFDQALLLQRDERAAHRRARGAQALGQLLLGQALAGFEGAAQDQVAQLHQNSLLQVHGGNCTLNKYFGIPF